jgi:MFS family permease
MVGLAVAFAVANTSASAVAQPAIAEDFGAGAAAVGWVVFGYTVSFAISTALYGRLAERMGTGRTLAFGILLLSVGSLLAAASPSLAVLIGARVLQGAGAGAIPTLSVATVATRLPAHRRAFGFGVITGAVGVAQALGPILGGLLVDFISWRAAVALGSLVAPVGLVVLYDQPGRGEDDRLPDVTGAVLVSVLVASFVFAVNRAPVDGATVATMVAVVLVLATVWLSARRTLRHPNSFIPRPVVADRLVVSAAVVGGLGSAAYLGVVVGLPAALGRMYEVHAVQIGFVLGPMALGVALASTLNSRVQARLGRSTTTLISLALLLAGSVGLAIVGVEHALITVAFLATPLGLGFGLLAPPLVGVVTERFGGQGQSGAIGVFYLTFFLGGAVGGAVATGFIQRQAALPGIEGGMATAAAILAVLVVIALLVARSAARSASFVPAERTARR